MKNIGEKFIKKYNMASVNRGLLALFCLVTWLLLSFYESALLQRVDAQSLFLFDGTFFERSMRVPAGFLGYVGSFLTQFMYYPALGAAVFVALLLIVYMLVRRVFRISDRWAVLAMVPMFLLLSLNTQLGYWIYYLKFPGDWFVPVIGTIVVLLAVWLFDRASYKWHIPVIVAWTILGYPLFGFYALFASLCMAVLSLSLAIRNGNRMRLVFDGVATVVVALALIIEVPLVCYEYYNSMAVEFVHTAGLPSYHWDIRTDHFNESIIPYWLPYILLFAYIILLSVIYNRLSSRVEIDKRYIVVNSLLLTASVLFSYFYWYSNDNFRIENKQDAAMWESDWRKVADYARDTKEPSRQIVMNKNIALLNLGTAGDEMFTYPDGSAMIDAPMNVHLTHTGGIMSYYCYGKFNFAYRWSVENAVEMGWKVEYLKHAIRSMLLQHEYMIARRYIEILKKAPFHRKWALHYEQFLDNPERIAKEREFFVPLQMCKYPDVLDVDDSYVEAYLIKEIPMGYTLENSPVYNEAALMSSLVRKDANMFWPNLARYLYNRKLKRLPTHYQEAVLLFSNLNRNVDVSQLKIDNSVRMRFNSFMQATKRYKGMKEEQMAPYMLKDYGRTYWYFYFFVRNIKTN